MFAYVMPLGILGAAVLVLRAWVLVSDAATRREVVRQATTAHSPKRRAEARELLRILTGYPPQDDPPDDGPLQRR